MPKQAFRKNNSNSSVALSFCKITYHQLRHDLVSLQDYLSPMKHDLVSLKVYLSSVTARPDLSKSIPIISDSMTLSLCKITYCQGNMTLSLWKCTYHQWQHDLISLKVYLSSVTAWPGLSESIPIISDSMTWSLGKITYCQWNMTFVSLQVYLSSVPAWPCLFPMVNGCVDLVVLFQHNHIIAIFYKVILLEFNSLCY